MSKRWELWIAVLLAKPHYGCWVWRGPQVRSRSNDWRGSGGFPDRHRNAGVDRVLAPGADL
jgi:hypothetical protein